MNNFPIPRGDMFMSAIELWGWLDRANMVRPLVGADVSRKNLFGDPYPAMDIQGNTALVPVSGALIKGATALDRMFGAASHDEIMSNLDAADANAAIKNIVLLVNSPGGTVAGTPETASKVASIAKRKNVVAFTDTLMGSAAYYIAAGAKTIYATPSSSVGSIGTMLEVANITEALKQRGISVELFVSDKLKGTGHPARPLSDDQRKYLQDRVNDQALEFKSFVKQNRRGVPDTAMLGQVFFGSAAAKVGLVDRVVSGLRDVLNELANPGSVSARTFPDYVAEFERRGMSKAAAVSACVREFPDSHRDWLMSGKTSPL